MINLEYQLTVNDRLEAEQAHILSPFELNLYEKNFGKIYWSIITGIWLLLGIKKILVLIDRISQRANLLDLSSSIFDGCLYLGCCILMLYSYLLKLNPFKVWRLKREFEFQSIMFQTRKITINETGVSFENKDYQEFKQWQNYLKFIETETVFLLYYADRLFHILPKRVFTDSSEIERLREILEKNLK